MRLIQSKARSPGKVSTSRYGYGYKDQGGD